MEIFSRSGPGCDVTVLLENCLGRVLCVLVGTWSLLRVDPGLNGTRCSPVLVTELNVV